MKYDGTGICVWDGVRCATAQDAAHFAAQRRHDCGVVGGRPNAARSFGSEIHLSDSEGRALGVLLPDDPFARLAVSAKGHYRGNARVERAIRMVVQKSDGTSETLTVCEFMQKYNFKNDTDKVRLIDK